MKLLERAEVADARLLGLCRASQAAPAAPPPAAGPSLTKHDKFNDLPDNVRSIIEGIEYVLLYIPAGVISSPVWSRAPEATKASS